MATQLFCVFLKIYVTFPFCYFSDIRVAVIAFLYNRKVKLRFTSYCNCTVTYWFVYSFIAYVVTRTARYINQDKIRIHKK